jgi:hypothetical protein
MDTDGHGCGKALPRISRITASRIGKIARNTRLKNPGLGMVIGGWKVIQNFPRAASPVCL